MTEHEQNIPSASYQYGAEIIRDFVKTLPKSAGVYRMLNGDGDVLYVGKAKNLPKRVISYTQINRLSLRIQRMVSLTKEMQFTETQTEAEALLLEANLIKKLKPRYNILLRDDKAFPCIHVTDHDYPMVQKHRGAQKAKGHYFGPFASASAVNETLTTLQKAFMLRNCSDHIFESRQRPCLQYQIKRCTAPCVHYVSQKTYAKQVKMARDFLSGKSKEIQEEMATAMQEASDALDFETAASFRDRIRALSTVQGQQTLYIPNIADADFMAVTQSQGQSCVMVLFYRAGQNYGHRFYYPRHEKDETAQDVLEAFIGQFYANKPAPKEIYCNVDIPHADLLMRALAMQDTPYTPKINIPTRGAKKQALEQAEKQAAQSLMQKITQQYSQKRHLEELANAFDLPTPLKRVEVYDNSHLSGQHALGAMIVVTEDGFDKNSYRKFNIKNPDITDDDFAMMDEVITRRFKNVQKNDPNREKGLWPDLLLIDGGKGQLNAVMNALHNLDIHDMAVIAIAKGPDRNAGRERFFTPDQWEVKIPFESALIHFLQRIRDESHRYVIGSHRTRRQKAAVKSPLDEMPGIGPKRKKALLHYFGSGKAVTEASPQELEKVDGISKAFAEKIYSFFHDQA